MSLKLDPFDREYTLPDLLTAEDLAAIFSGFKKAAAASVFILLPGGKLYYALAANLPANDCPFTEIPEEKRLELIDAPSGPGDGCISFPLHHELEVIGHLVFLRPSTESDPVPQTWGKGLADCLDRLIACNYKNRMTAGIHGRVVEESYAALKEKAVLLETSEARYRQLAQNLELEVETKTRQIKETQGQMMQQEKMASIGHLAAGVAHEINNPMGFITSNLNTLEGYLQNLQEFMAKYRSLSETLRSEAVWPALPDQLRQTLSDLKDFETTTDLEFVLEDTPELIKESKEGAERIRKIVYDLKDFAHPGKQDPEYVDVHQNIDSTINIVWNELKYKATVVREYGDIPHVECFPQQLNQVFMNLLVNAAQAIAEQGEIRIRTTCTDGWVQIGISDNGTGIPEAHLARIFDPFFTTKPVGQGTGLGLNLAYNIIQNHQGTINVKSTCGSGTCFTITIPVSQNP